MAEYGTYRIYNQLLGDAAGGIVDADGNEKNGDDSEAIKEVEEAQDNLVKVQQNQVGQRKLRFLRLIWNITYM